MSEVAEFHVLHETLESSFWTQKKLVPQYHDGNTGIAGGGDGFGGSSVGTLQFLSWPKPATETTPAQQQQQLAHGSQVYKPSHSAFFYDHIITEKRGSQSNSLKQNLELLQLCSVGIGASLAHKLLERITVCNGKMSSTANLMSKF